MERTYFTLKEMLKAITSDSTSGELDFDTDGTRFEAFDIDELQLSELMKKFNTGFSSRILTVADDSIVRRLWSDYIIPACWDCLIAYADEYDQDTATTFSTFYKFFSQMCAWIAHTAVNRITIIEYYEDSKTTLMDEVSQVTSNASSFNDTPQGIEDYTDDQHNTNTSKSSSTTTNELTTVVARLDEVNRLYDNLFIQWSKEFCERFVYCV